MATRCHVLLLLAAAFASLLALVAAEGGEEGPRGRRLLVLLDDLAVRSSHSAFFGSLQARGFDLDFRLADDPKLSLHRYGQYLYDGLVLFAPSTPRFGGSVDQNAVLEFIDAGHDMILAADSSASDLIRGIATECGDPEAMVIDHMNYAVTDVEGDHTLIAGDDLIHSDVILGSEKIEAPVLFRGIGHMANPSNSLVLKVLSASPSAYSANPKTKLASPPSLTGSAISLVSVMQNPCMLPFILSDKFYVFLKARNNARVLLSGSLDLFSNRFLKSGVQKADSKTRYERAGNEQFVAEISKWVFHERGHLKAVNVRHHKVGETNEPGMYRINDDLEYSVEIYEWSGTSWKPYVADDVQLQFFMMSPYVLKTMSTDNKGLYSTTFKVPDVYGVFQFKVEYQRLGYTGLSFTKQIPVRPYRHNEYERFITSAYPYYTASFSTMGAFFVFSFVYLYHK
ncbi:hypothetical protein Zm00014a_039795 [Zea mays]|uniref:Dolichyl-diphosphooligosaccharide--protein glycosyltransferase 48 kDa subunit n=2 Tax=Zea mays TaxID=4577 RepID=A0A8J8XF10_MAIZE|nr:Dolichyl-diphosphooligosaccharide--protein glycosyltransferase 48 kDa subunit [Zea mays]ONM52394.1 Dolichyl-diphosphooligosaccharide--protein glycosyltransferase 48 kDa subunit [Zea mays]PWZ15052.1 Dolichyl-diphosphooligosaccharide--protein glycosyltransferase subunit [Zea mays]PWZ15053.1 hypothetical protein Zm00014a_039795 [Zea mays]PWZ15054.1 hypothetical protein Zm00014a_039795 [Zea mays]